MSITRDKLLDLLKTRITGGAPLRLPPPCLTEMQAEPAGWEDGVSLSMRFPVLERWQNPLGYMQGGFIAAALDNTLGPFSYLVAPPSVTTQMNINYLRPVSPDITHIFCTARLVERTGKTLYLAGEVNREDGKTIALCQAVCQLL